MRSSANASIPASRCGPGGHDAAGSRAARTRAGRSETRSSIGAPTIATSTPRAGSCAIGAPPKEEAGVVGLSGAPGERIDRQARSPPSSRSPRARPDVRRPAARSRTRRNIRASGSIRLGCAGQASRELDRSPASYRPPRARGAAPRLAENGLEHAPSTRVVATAVRTLTSCVRRREPSGPWR